jgi:hypothetical protein
MQVRYEPCVIDRDGNCTRWSHDHSAGLCAACESLDVPEGDPCPCLCHMDNPT